MTFENFIKEVEKRECHYKAFAAWLGCRLTKKVKSRAALIHGVLGMVTEAGELMMALGKTNQIEEIGDILWYMVIVCRETGNNFEMLNWDLYPVDPHAMEDKDVAFSVSLSVDGLKREAFYKNPNQEKITEHLNKIASVLCSYCFANNFTLSDAMEANTRKLEARFGKKFSRKAALNRDLKAEEKALEGTK